MVDSVKYLDGKQCFIKDDTLYILGEFNQDISNNIIPEMNNIIDRLSQTKDPVFEIVINSRGGFTDELFSLLYYIDIMKSIGVKVITKIIGVAHSCALFLACYGSERYMYKYSNALLHLGAYSAGDLCTFKDIEYITRDSNRHFNNIIELLETHSKMDKDQIKSLLTNDNLFLTPQECLEYGLIDYIV